MKNLSILAILALIFLSGCQTETPDLRVDDLFFGNKRVGLQADEPVFHPGEEFYFNYAIRGVQKDKDGFADISFLAKFSDSEKSIGKFDHARYKINSDITSYGPTKPSEHKLPSDASGPGELVLTVTDHVADLELVVICPYQVEAKAEQARNG